jgi:hypothetical protein
LLLGGEFSFLRVHQPLFMGWGNRFAGDGIFSGCKLIVVTYHGGYQAPLKSVMAA